MLKNKKLIKAFTLVEMLIVVIIIGILMSALLPKLTGAQAGARDTARIKDVADISAALAMYFNNVGEYPSKTCASDLVDDLKSYMTNIPEDPQKVRKTYGSQSNGCTSGSYGYSAITSNGGEKGGSVVIANVESFGRSANWVLSGNNYKNNPQFKEDVEYTDIHDYFCETVIKGNSVASGGCTSTDKEGETSEQNQMVFVQFN